MTPEKHSFQICHISYDALQKEGRIHMYSLTEQEKHGLIHITGGSKTGKRWLEDRVQVKGRRSV